MSKPFSAPKQYKGTWRLRAGPWELVAPTLLLWLGSRLFVPGRASYLFHALVYVHPILLLKFLRIKKHKPWLMGSRTKADNVRREGPRGVQGHPNSFQNSSTRSEIFVLDPNLGLSSFSPSRWERSLC